MKHAPHFRNDNRVFSWSARDFWLVRLFHAARRGSWPSGKGGLGGSQLRYLGSGIEIWSMSIVRLNGLSLWPLTLASCHSFCCLLILINCSSSFTVSKQSNPLSCRKVHQGRVIFPSVKLSLGRWELLQFPRNQELAARAVVGCENKRKDNVWASTRNPQVFFLPNRVCVFVWA